MVKNAEEVLNTIYSTNFTQFLQGLGLPVLGTWYNFNSTMSKTDNGTEDIDHLLGKESPVRYNKILNMPVYGLPKDMNPEITAGEGGLLDMNMELGTFDSCFTIRALVFLFGRLFSIDNRSGSALC